MNDNAVTVSNLTRNSPATRGGLEIGDVILEINGEKITSEDEVWGILNDAKACGADVVAVACPLCQVNLDGRQSEILRKNSSWQSIPVIFLSQLVGRAIGVSDKELGLKKHLVDVMAVMS